MSDVTKQIEEIGKAVFDFQERHTEFEKKGVEVDDSLKKIQAAFEEKSTALDELTKKMEAETKAREELELSLASINESGQDSKDIKSNPEYLKSFDSYLRYKTLMGNEPLDAEFKNLLKVSGLNLDDEQARHVKTMIVGSNPDGGYFAPVDMQSGIIQRVYETSAMRNIATVITTGAESVEYVISDDDGFNSGWVGEIDARPNTDTGQIGLLTIPTHEQYAQPLASQKMLDDSTVPIEPWINGQISEKFAREENTTFVNGTGIKQPVGFMSLADWTTLGVYERNALETRQTAAAAPVGDDFIDLQTDLLEYYQPNARWAMARKVWAEVIKFKDTDGQYLLNPAMLFAGVQGLQFLGKPVVLFSDMEDTVAEGNTIAAYGDFRAGYTIVDRIGIRILRDPLTTKGFVKFYTTKRVGGAVVNFQAIKRLKVLESTT
jgi:HK97 family phage major capsid protein